MKLAPLLLIATIVSGIGAEPVIPEGKYSPPVPLFGGRFLELSKGHFTLEFVADTGPDPQKKKKPLFAAVERGRYQIDGKRLILLGDNPLLGEVLFYQEIDGVSVLLTQQAVFYDDLDGHPVVEFFVLKPKDAEEGTGWWQALLKAHPTFAKWANQ